MLWNEISARIAQASAEGIIQNKMPYDLVMLAIPARFPVGVLTAATLYWAVDEAATIAELQLSPPAPTLD